MTKNEVNQLRKEAFFLKKRNKVLHAFEEFIAWSVITAALLILLLTFLPADSLKPVSNEVIIGASVFMGLLAVLISTKYPVVIIIWRFFPTDYKGIRQIIEKRVTLAIQQQQSCMTTLNNKEELFDAAKKQVEKQLQGTQKALEILTEEIKQYDQYLLSIKDK